MKAYITITISTTAKQNLHKYAAECTWCSPDNSLKGSSAPTKTTWPERMATCKSSSNLPSCMDLSIPCV